MLQPPPYPWHTCYTPYLHEALDLGQGTCFAEEKTEAQRFCHELKGDQPECSGS